MLAIPLGKTGREEESFQKEGERAESLYYFWLAQSGAGWKSAACLLEYAEKVKLDHDTPDTKAPPVAQSTCLASFP